MYSINSLVQSVFPFNIMEYIPNPSFARNNYCFFIKLIGSTMKHIFRPNKKWISPVCNSILTITIASPYFCDFTYLHPSYALRTSPPPVLANVNSLFL